MRPHHDDLVLCRVVLGPGVQTDQVETLGNGLAWLPELDNHEWLISRFLRFLSDQLTDLLSELWRTEDLSASEKAQGPQPSHDEATWEQNISHICSPISLKGFGWVDWNQSFNWILRLCLPTLLVRVMFLWLCLGRVNPLRSRSFSWDLIQFDLFWFIYLIIIFFSLTHKFNEVF